MLSRSGPRLPRRQARPVRPGRKPGLPPGTASRMPYSPTSVGALGPALDLPDAPPCPAPAGGWSVSQDWFDDPVRDYLHAPADQFAEPFATHSGNARILVVEVVSGDVDQARAALTAIYTENLCVVAAPGKHSIADDDKLQATTGKAVLALMDDTALGIYTPIAEDGKIRGEHGPVDAAAIRQVRRDRPRPPDPRSVDPPARPVAFRGCADARMRGCADARVMVCGVSGTGRHAPVSGAARRSAHDRPELHPS
jgi:hypothetical protein